MESSTGASISKSSLFCTEHFGSDERKLGILFNCFAQRLEGRRLSNNIKL